MNITLKPRRGGALVLNRVLSPHAISKHSSYGTLHYHTGFTVPGYFIADAGVYQPVPCNGFTYPVVIVFKSTRNKKRLLYP